MRTKKRQWMRSYDVPIAPERLAGVVEMLAGFLMREEAQDPIDWEPRLPKFSAPQNLNLPS
jgi:hypothetical protein